jgi:hypothetical protein
VGERRTERRKSRGRRKGDCHNTKAEAYQALSIEDMLSSAISSSQKDIKKERE